MTIEIKVPMLPESVSDATIAAWHKKEGEQVTRDENIVDLETDKVVLEVPAPEDGILKEIRQAENATVNTGDVIAIIEVGQAKKTTPETAAPQASVSAEATTPSEDDLSPAVRRLVAEKGIDVSQISGSGKNGRITKQDVETHVKQATQQPKPSVIEMQGERIEKRVPMTRLRARIAERLLGAQHNAAILTTFNEVNMQAVMNLRAEYKETFEKVHGVKLGFMSFFTKAAVEALKRFPDVNASIEGSDIIYHGYFDVGIAVSTDRGLVVPVVREADKKSLAEIEASIGDFAEKARNNEITIEDMTGGTFTITNGGVFGSLLATPILNPPQSGILGLHKIEKRPIVENDQIVIRPMMYIALSYDHRIIDGRESVQFLRTIKDIIEDPARLLLEV